MKIERPDFRFESIEDEIVYYNKTYEIIKKQISENDLPIMHRAVADFIETANLSIYVNQQGVSHEEKFSHSVRENLTMSLETIVSIYQLALSKGKKTRISIGGSSMEAKVDIDELGSAVNVAMWEMGWHLAHILRDKKALELLLSVPDKIFRYTNLSMDEFNYLYVDFLKSLYSSPDNAKDKLMQAYKAADPSKLKIETPLYVLNKESLEMEVYMAFLMEDEALINNNLAKLLEGYKFIIEHDEKTNSPAWLISIAAAGIASFAYHNGYKIEVESDYMPRMLVEGTF